MNTYFFKSIFKKKDIKGKERKKAKENGIRCSHLRKLEEYIVIFFYS